MSYNLRMFDSNPGVIVVRSSGYASIVAHSHEFVEIVFIEQGQAISLVGSEFVKLKAGDLFVIADRMVSHAVQPVGGEEELSMINVIFPFEFYELDYGQFNPLNVIPIDKIKGGRELIYGILEEYEQKRPHFERITYALNLCLISKLMRFNGSVERDGKTVQKMQVSGYIDKAINYIHDNYDKPITVDDVARECGLCKAYLQRIFKKERNTTIKEYIIKYRIEQSCKLLLCTEYPISTISEMVGFFNLKYFYLKFKEIVGDSPKNYKAGKRRIAK